VRIRCGHRRTFLFQGARDGTSPRPALHR
jgi:hypothetical protein